MDLDSTARASSGSVIGQILKQTRLKLEVGGGLRETSVIQSLLTTGVARCVVGTKALENWTWFDELVHTPAMHGRHRPRARCPPGQARRPRLDAGAAGLALRVADKVAGWPLGAIIYTDIGHDGMLLGPNIDATRTVAERSTVPVIASGGVTDIEDVKHLVKLPLLGIIIGRAIYEKQLDLTEAVKIASAA